MTDRSCHRFLRLIFVSIVFIAGLTGCSYEKAFKGKVVDEGTGDPIEGVVALATWTISTPSAAGSISRYHDVYETVTDANGDFFISGKGLNFWDLRDAMWVTFFKTGFLSQTGQERNYKTYTVGGNTVVRLKSLTLEQRKTVTSPPSPPHEAPYYKVKLYLHETDKESIETGFEPRGVWHGVHYE